MVRELYLCHGAQAGKTVISLACIAHAAANDPSPAFLCGPDEVFLKKFYKDKLYPILELCKDTRDLLLPSKFQLFPTIDIGEMLVHGAYSGSATRMGDVSARYGFYLELDKWDDSASREADPEYLAGERRKSWPNYKILKEGTPTDETSRIMRNLDEAGAVLYYHVPCPHCKKYQRLKMGTGERGEGGVMFDRDEQGRKDPDLARKTAHYECEHCGGEIRNRHRRKMLRSGVWAPEGHEIPADCKSLVLWGKNGPQRRVGTQLSSLYSPLLTWGDVAEAFVLAQKSPKALQNFVNGWLAEVFKQKKDVPDWRKFRDTHSRPEGFAVVPEWAHVLVAGTDIHKARNHLVVTAWGPGPMCQAIYSAKITEPIHDVQDRVDSTFGNALGREFFKESGAALTVRLLMADSGYKTREVYRACDNWGARATPIREATRRTGAPAPFQLSPREADKKFGKKHQRPKFKPRGGRGLLIIDGDFWASELNSMLTKDPDEYGSMLIHDKADEDFVRAVCNVYPSLKKDKRGRERIEWRVDDDTYKDHYFDALSYCVLGAEVLGIRYWTGEEKPRPMRTAKQKKKKADRQLTFRKIETR